MGGEGHKFGQYSLGRLIATGGMAEVYIARHEGTAGFARTIVIKRIHHHLSEDPAFVNMFLDEARLVARLSHPNIVAVHDFGVAEGDYYLAMEYVHGVSLAQAVERGKGIDPAHAIRISTDLCSALHYAHSLKDEDGRSLRIVHRDVSPDNVLISYDGPIKLIDFGVAKAKTQAYKTVFGAVKGKYSYASPEQVSGRRVDRRSDVFSVGIVTWEMLVGERLFRRETVEDTLKAVRGDDPPSVYERVPGLPADIDNILAKAMAKKPDDRYDDCSELLFALDDLAVTAGLHSNSLRRGRYIRELFNVSSGTGEVRLPSAMRSALEGDGNQGGASLSSPPPASKSEVRKVLKKGRGPRLSDFETGETGALPFEIDAPHDEEERPRRASTGVPLLPDQRTNPEMCLSDDEMALLGGADEASDQGPVEDQEVTALWTRPLDDEPEPGDTGEGGR